MAVRRVLRGPIRGAESCLGDQGHHSRTESNPKALSVPLEVGRRWRYTSEWLFKPKGSKIDAETTTTYWYAPAVRAIVKSEFHNPTWADRPSSWWISS